LPNGEKGDGAGEGWQRSGEERKVFLAQFTAFWASPKCNFVVYASTDSYMPHATFSTAFVRTPAYSIPFSLSSLYLSFSLYVGVGVNRLLSLLTCGLTITLR